MRISTTSRQGINTPNWNPILLHIGEYFVPILDDEGTNQRQSNKKRNKERGKEIVQTLHIYYLYNIILVCSRLIQNSILRMLVDRIRCEMLGQNGFLQEEVIGSRDYNLQQTYQYKTQAGLYEDFTGDIRSVLFTGIEHGVFSTAQFNSKEGELILAQLLDSDDDVQNWLRPHPREFNITYNCGHIYEPDFVVETKHTIYLVKVKGKDKLNDPGVITKKKRGVQYCEVSSRWGKTNSHKEWCYLFIPSKQILLNSSFMQLTQRFQEL